MISRRALLHSGAVSATAAATASALAACSPHNSSQHPHSSEPSETLTNDAPSYPYYGDHQPGILINPQRHAAYTAFQVTANNRAELKDLLTVITKRAALLHTEYTPEIVGITAPPSDSGTVGPQVNPNGLTVTLGLGASLFDHRFGLTAARPKHLTPMTSFPNDDLQLDKCHGDLLLQIRAHDHDTVLHALRDITRHTRGAMQIQWRAEGYISPPRPTGTPRNHFGFKDGIANPDPTNAAEMNRLVWTGHDDLPWTKHGTYIAVRLISMLVEFWDRISISEQENIFGRNRDTGAPLDGNHETDTPDYIDDPLGKAIPLNAHIRMANPRTPATDDSRILRRAYNYSQGTDANGNLNLGLIFTCFQQNIERQFVATQTRLIDEPLVDYVIPYGGGYFFVPPGVKNRTGFLGEGMFA